MRAPNCHIAVHVGGEWSENLRAPPRTGASGDRWVVNAHDTQRSRVSQVGSENRRDVVPTSLPKSVKGGRWGKWVAF